nr:MAG TPA: hypothetical protein [Caudoviricetes sp.]
MRIISLEYLPTGLNSHLQIQQLMCYFYYKHIHQKQDIQLLYLVYIYHLFF